MDMHRASTRLLVAGLIALPAGVGATLPQSFAASPTSASAALADPSPEIGEWPLCGTAPDTDGRYCIASMKRNGTVIVHPAAGDYYLPSIDMIGAGVIRFGVTHYRDGQMVTRDNGAGGLMADAELIPTDVFEIVVNSGAIVPREFYGNAQDVTFTRAGNAARGHTFTLRMRPAPFAWLKVEDGQPYPCTIDGCGGDTAVADPFWTYDGFITGYVSELAHLGADQQRAMTGLVHAYNAQAENLYYDPMTNALVIQLGNAHFKEPGVVATGSYQAFLPYAMLTEMMGVPEPKTLTGGSMIVTRVGAPAVPFTLTHHDQGVDIRIPGITYSTPTYRIKARRTAPGRPLLRRVARVAQTVVKLRFTPPVADGGAPITAYRARCRRGTRPWVRASGAASPIRVRGVSRRAVTCQVRAVNRVGVGPWSVSRRG